MNEERRKMLDELEAKNRKYIADLTDTYIKKLAVTTGIYDCILDPYDKLNNGNQESSIMCDLERFAQLIISECMYQCDIISTLYDEHRLNSVDFPTKNVYAEGSLGAERSKYRIRDHFGVK